MQFIGTGAGEAIPNPFCRCEVCENARRVGGKEIRLRSCFKLNKTTLIDAGGDFLAASALYNIDFCDIRHIIFSHTHSDHFAYGILWEHAVRATDKGEKLHLYFVGDAIKVLERFDSNYPDLVFHRVEFGEEVDIDGSKFVAYPGRHYPGIEKNAANFLVTSPEGKKLYYACDSGWFFDETFEALKGAKLDAYIGEMTYADPSKPAAPKTDGHMNAQLFIETCDKLCELGAITSETRIFATHINSFGWSHARLVEYFDALEKPYKIDIAYDTLEAEL